MQALLVPLVSPFTDDGSTLSEVRLARIMRFYREHHARGFVVAGEVGEFATLALSERKDLVEWALREAGGLDVFVHVGATTTASALDLAQHAARHGARAAIVTPPLLGRPTLREVVGHFHVVARHAGLPVIAMDAGLLSGEEIEAVSASLAERGDIVQAFGQNGGPFSVTAKGSPDEFTFGGETGTSIAVLGNTALVEMVRRNPDLLNAWRHLLAEAGPARVARAYLALAAHDPGPPRAPYLPLADPYFARLREIVQL